jgi:5-methylcytosine-specific restriction endonuclease McrA
MGNKCGGEYKRRRKANLIKRFGAYCFYCKCQLTTKYANRHAKNYATLDHYIPKCRVDGEQIEGNKILACRGCNEKKGAMMPREFMKLLSKATDVTDD